MVNAVDPYTMAVLHACSDPGGEMRAHLYAHGKDRAKLDAMSDEGLLTEIDGRVHLTARGRALYIKMRDAADASGDRRYLDKLNAMRTRYDRRLTYMRDRYRERWGDGCGVCARDEDAHARTHLI